MRRMQAQLFASRGYYLLYATSTIYYVHVAVLVDTTSSEKSLYLVSISYCSVNI